MKIAEKTSTLTIAIQIDPKKNLLQTMLEQHESEEN